MSDEYRMLRLTKDQFHRIAIRFQHKNSAQGSNHEMMVAVGMPKELGERFEMLDLAPSDVWKPMCFNSDSHYCRGLPTNEESDACNTCPYIETIGFSVRNFKDIPIESMKFPADEDVDIIASSPYDENGFKPTVLSKEGSERFLKLLEEADHELEKADMVKKGFYECVQCSKWTNHSCDNCGKYICFKCTCINSLGHFCKECHHRCTMGMLR